MPFCVIQDLRNIHCSSLLFHTRLLLMELLRLELNFHINYHILSLNILVVEGFHRMGVVHSFLRRFSRKPQYQLPFPFFTRLFFAVFHRNLSYSIFN